MTTRRSVKIPIDETVFITIKNVANVKLGQIVARYDSEKKVLTIAINQRFQTTKIEVGLK